jgi:hypothetical protein
MNNTVFNRLDRRARHWFPRNIDWHSVMEDRKGERVRRLFLVGVTETPVDLNDFDSPDSIIIASKKKGFYKIFKETFDATNDMYNIKFIYLLFG